MWELPEIWPEDWRCFLVSSSSMDQGRKVWPYERDFSSKTSIIATTALDCQLSWPSSPNCWAIFSAFLQQQRGRPDQNFLRGSTQWSWCSLSLCLHVLTTKQIQTLILDTQNPIMCWKVHSATAFRHLQSILAICPGLMKVSFGTIDDIVKLYSYCWEKRKLQKCMKVGLVAAMIPFGWHLGCRR